MNTLWVAVVVSSLGCAALKVSGYVVPARALQRGAVQRIVEALPVALLSALIAVSTFASGHHLAADSRAVGLGVAIALVLLRAPFLLVVAGACAAAAGAHALHL